MTNDTYPMSLLGQEGLDINNSEYPSSSHQTTTSQNTFFSVVSTRAKEVNPLVYLTVAIMFVLLIAIIVLVNGRQTPESRGFYVKEFLSGDEYMVDIDRQEFLHDNKEDNNVVSCTLHRICDGSERVDTCPDTSILDMFTVHKDAQKGGDRVANYDLPQGSFSTACIEYYHNHQTWCLEDDWITIYTGSSGDEFLFSQHRHLDQNEIADSQTC
ncbi:hypothetical protein P9112_011633 [Eukaryota sp. TZLM1-RC]